MNQNPPILKQFAQFWTMIEQPSAAAEWTLEEKLHEIKKAGFVAAGGAPLPNIAALCAQHELEYVCYIDVNRETYRERLEAARATNPVRVNVQLCDDDTRPAEATQVWIKTEKLAQKMGLEVDVEVHRDTSTETPEKTYEIAARYEKATGQKIRFCWDFSHLALIKHLTLPYANRLLIRPDLIQLSRQFHFRPFTGQHCQIAVTDSKGALTMELRNYLDFLDALLTIWLQGAKGGEVLYVCPELGPVRTGYGLSIFPNIWEDAKVLRQKIERLWQSKITTWKPHA